MVTRCMRERRSLVLSIDQLSTRLRDIHHLVVVVSGRFRDFKDRFAAVFLKRDLLVSDLPSFELRLVRCFGVGPSFIVEVELLLRVLRLSR